MARIRITAAGKTFIGETHPDAPKTVAAFMKMLPYKQKVIHVRWSGEGVWVPLGENTSMSPYASLDYSSTDTARALVLPPIGLVSAKDKQKGTTGSLGTSIDRRFGSESQHSISANAAWVITSNSAATSSTLIRRSGAARPLRPQAGAGGSENWFEYGASASFGVSDVVNLSLSASRTVGTFGPETTSLYTGVSFSF